VRRCGIEDYLRHQRIEVCPDTPLPTAGLLENRDGGVVGLQIARGRDLAAEFVANGRERSGDIRDPATQRRAREIEVLAVKDPLQAIERQMIELLRDDDVREQAFGGE